MSRILLALTAALALSAAVFATAVEDDAVIRFDGAVFSIIGKEVGPQPRAGWDSVFRVYAGSSDLQPMAGSYRVEGAALVFQPRFPIEPGVHYHAVFHGVDGFTAEAGFDGPARAVNRVTRVDRVYPSSDILPGNVLRLYIWFSAPMSRGEAWQHIHLIDAESGQPVELPFLELEQELWNRTNQCLTVLFDPGRIKRGLVPTSTIGPAVVEGKHYRFTIDREWKDARGVGLVEPFEKVFRGGPSDRVPPAIQSWRVTPPRAGSSDPLLIVFPKPMDSALTMRMIGIFDGRSELAGRIELGAHETEWRFFPREPWKAGRYRIEADNALEDIAGNHLDRPFDVDVFETVTKHIVTETSSVDFNVVNRAKNEQAKP